MIAVHAAELGQQNVHAFHRLWGHAVVFFGVAEAVVGIANDVIPRHRVLPSLLRLLLRRVLPGLRFPWRILASFLLLY